MEAVTGAGLTGHRDGHRLRLGRPGWIAPGPLAEPVAAMQAAGATSVLVENDDQLIGAIGVRDELRPEAAEVVAREFGISRDSVRRWSVAAGTWQAHNSSTLRALQAENAALRAQLGL